MVKHWIKTILSLTLILVLGACGQENKKDVSLVDFTGMNKNDVETWRTENNISTDEVKYAYEYNETIPKDTVISQSIPAGQPLDGRNLTITLSNGVDPQAEITLIDFTGMSLADIQQWFINEHFEQVSVEYVYDPAIPVGQFVGTSVTDGKACRDEPIVIQISGDPEQAGVAVTVPDMSGWTQSQAEQWANTNQITIDYSITMSETVPQGCVASQSPVPNSEIVKGDHMQVSISGGSQVQAIDLTGMSSDDINAWGQQNDIQISWMQCWNAAPSGTVYWNQPNSGTMRMGDIMKVYISVGPIPVADYTGLSYQNNFMGWLNSINDQYYQSANLNVTVSTQATSDVADGVIISQQPNSGYLDPGSTINLVIAQHVDPQPTPTPEPGGLKVNVPSMTGSSESDFLGALQGYGMAAGNRTEQYSKVIAQGYILYNDTGSFDPGSSINYVVSLGQFKVIPQYWAGKNYTDLVSYIDSANRMGANVSLDTSYENTNDVNSDKRVKDITGPLDDGVVHVTVWRLVLY
ncbi:MAG: PASTA domain-containing protein [Solobacterium sp.]|nr:PASTA domain-containing protein [Solobacterium sp.]